MLQKPEVLRSILCQFRRDAEETILYLTFYITVAQHSFHALQLSVGLVDTLWLSPIEMTDDLSSSHREIRPTHPGYSAFEARIFTTKRYLAIDGIMWRAGAYLYYRAEGRADKPCSCHHVSFHMFLFAFFISSMFAHSHSLGSFSKQI